MTPKHKKGGVVTSTVLGIGGLIIAVVVLLTILATVLDTDVISQTTANTTYYNQTMTAMNNTAQTFGNSTLLGARCSVMRAFNSTNASQTIHSGNYTFYSNNCSVVCDVAGQYQNETWNITSTTLYTTRSGNLNETVFDASKNLTSGINEVSQKLPTILLIVAVVFLFGALVLLIRNMNSLGFGDRGSL